MNPFFLSLLPFIIGGLGAFVLLVYRCHMLEQELGGKR